MQAKNAFIHVFKTFDNYYIYDVNTNTIVNVSEDVYKYFKDEVDDTKCNKETLDRISNLMNKGFLSEKRISEIEHPYTELIPFYIKNRMNTITLQVTQQCNLRCKYCAYSGTYENRIHNEKSMSLDIAKKGIDYMIKNSSESKQLNIGFYGGEPLLRFEFIKECVEYAKEQSEGKALNFHMTTNGTIMNDEIMSFLAQNNFNLLISLDGPEEIHDKNRVFAANGKGSFKHIMKNVSEFKSKYEGYVNKKVHFNAVLDGTCDFRCTNNFFNSSEDIKDMRINVSSITESYSKEKRKINEDFITAVNYEKFKIMLNKIGKLDEKYMTNLFTNEFSKLKQNIYDRHFQNKINEKEHPGGPCIPGIRKLFLSVNGTFYPCERVSELSDVVKIGNVKEGLDVEKIKKIINVGKLSEDLCKNCWAYRFCYSCVAFSDDLKGLSREKKILNCPRIIYNVEEDLKDFCMLIELGYDFEKESIKYELA